MERREHHRAAIQMPIRLRWTAPLGQKIEIRETVDVSRTGLQVACGEMHDPGVPLWVTFPYDDSLGDGQPEILANVVRVAHQENGYMKRAGNGARRKRSSSVVGSVEHGLLQNSLGLRFQLEHHQPKNSNGGLSRRERRANSRVPVSLPIHVRLEGVPWFEESMTVDVSSMGLRFLTNREYVLGRMLLVRFADALANPWGGAREFRSRVVRVAVGEQWPTLAVSVCRLV